MVKAGLNFQKQLTQQPLVEKFVNNTAYFKHSHHADFDMVIFCTGYKWHFPFIADDLRLKELFVATSKDF